MTILQKRSLIRADSASVSNIAVICGKSAKYHSMARCTNRRQP
jgi:hypothetical protein